MLFYKLFVCKCLLHYCHGVPTQLQLTNISYNIFKNTGKILKIVSKRLALTECLRKVIPKCQPEEK